MAIPFESPGPARRRVLYGISFDGVAISGIVTEFAKLAEIFWRHGSEVHLDLGYDIKADKDSFFRPYGGEAALLPRWIQLARIDGLAEVEGYGAGLARDVLEHFVRDPGGLSAHARRVLEARIDALAAQIAARIVATWRRLGVTFVVVENGTLPENVVFTRALYRAIDLYGRERRLGTFVLWRDHDVMWFCERSKYGPACYSAVPRLRDSPHIRYAALTRRAGERLSEWSNGVEVEVLPNCFEFAEARVTPANAALRRDFGIPEEALLIARCTRVIPQKRIDREIHLLAALRQRMRAAGRREEVCLFVTGDTGEDPAESGRLAELARSLGVAPWVVFGNGLSGREGGRGYTVRDLLAHADLSSFLTSYDYEGFGNPPAEAAAAKRPFISTTYELYPSVYGEKGFKTLPLPISRHRDGLAPEGYAESLLALLLDRGRRRRWAEHNFELGRGHFSLDALEHRLQDLFAGSLPTVGPRWMRRIPRPVPAPLPLTAAS